MTDPRPGPGDRPGRPRRPLAIAHRGTPRAYVENTLAGVLEAVRLGADAVEVDVRHTADGVAVVHHDRTLSRLWRHDAAVEELTRAQLRVYAPELPALAELLAAVRPSGVPLLLDLGSVRAADAALAAVDEVTGSAATGLPATASLPAAGAAGVPAPGPAGPAPVWFCGDPRALAWLREQRAELPRMLSWERRRPPPEPVWQAVAPTYFNLKHRLLDRRVIRRWHERGVLVCAWTVDRARRRRALLNAGVDALISNDVAGLVRDVHSARGAA